MTTIDNEITALGELADQMTAWLKASTAEAKADEARRTNAVLDFTRQTAADLGRGEIFKPNTYDLIRIRQLLPATADTLTVLSELVDEQQKYLEAEADWDHNDPQAADPEQYWQKAIEIAQQAVNADRIQHHTQTPTVAASAIEAPATVAQSPIIEFESSDPVLEADGDTCSICSKHIGNSIDFDGESMRWQCTGFTPAYGQVIDGDWFLYCETCVPVTA